MTNFEKQENSKYFAKLMKTVKEGGIALVPCLGASFQVINGKMIGSYQAITALRKMTDKSFHARTVII